MAESLELKWGTLKGWDVSEDGPAFAAIKKYHDAGSVQFSVMAQHDNEEQKKALCEAIDAVDGEIWNDWDGVVMTKEDAKKYVMEYRRG